jgi:hypothetical protein
MAVVKRPRQLMLDALRAIWRHFPGRPRFTFEDDGMATTHYSPFLDDPPFQAAYDRVADRFTGDVVDVRWRAWLLTRLARQCTPLGGNLAEFGTYRGACAALVLTFARMRPGQELFLFDTFEGIPAAGLTDNEQRLGFQGRLADTSAEQVEGFLTRWATAGPGASGPQRPFRLVQGDVMDTVNRSDVGALCFAHVDLNAAKATVVATEYAYDRLVPGGIILFDDYGWRGYEDQRRLLDDFFASRDEQPIALPTGQAFVVRRARREDPGSPAP